MTEDPSDFRVITPSHLLVGFGLQSIPEADLQKLKINTLDRFQLVERMKQEFWHRWTMDYLPKLQVKPKWTKEEKDFQVGELTIIIEENLPPNQWKLARIKEIRPSQDGHVRTVILETGGKYTQNGTRKIKEFTRPISSICHLPYVYDEERPENQEGPED